jgi:hypothetical protein
VTRRVAKERIEYVTEQVVRPVTVQKEVYKDEVVVEEIPVQTTRYEKVVQKVQVPYKVMKTVPVTEMQLVPRLVTRRVPIDINGIPVVDTPIVSLAAPSSSVTGNAPAAQASPSDIPQNVQSRKPAVTESGDLPAPATPNAPSAPVEPAGSGTSSKTELQLGPATGGDPEADKKPELAPKEQAPEQGDKPTKIRVSEDE